MESCENSKQSYILALLTLVESQPGAEENPLFGVAMRLDTGNGIYRQSSHRFLKALIEHSPSPETLAGQFLKELAKCKIPAVETLVGSLQNGDRSISPGDWAAGVYNELNENDANILPVTSLANYYLTNLVIAFRNPTPQESLPPSPNPYRTSDISLLLEQASACDQAALKQLILRRDGYSCPVTGVTFEGDGSVTPQCAHIIPSATHGGEEPMLDAIEMFTGNQLKAEIVNEFIKNPANAINLQFDAHYSMERDLAWGIEAKLIDNEWKYYFRVVRLPCVPKCVRLFIQDGDEMNLGGGVDGAAIPLPDPELCNLHLAVSRVFVESGYAEVVEEFEKDNSDPAPGLCGEDRRRLLLSLVSS